MIDQAWLNKLNQSIDEYYDQHGGELGDVALSEILSDFADQYPEVEKRELFNNFHDLEQVSSGLPKLINAFYDDQLLPQGTRLSQYRIQHLIGEGGMGEVYLAERADGQFEQKYALKVLSKGWMNNQIIQRFLQERQILAKLKHPNIAAMHDAGVTEDNRPWFVMDYIEGRDIDQYCYESNLSVEAIIDLMIDICQAMAYAHSQGIVHRDLKPANILMVEQVDQVRPVLLDFGVASRADNRQVTQTGYAIGTSGFMSPEQINGESLIDGRSDVFSVGIILYQLISRKHPFKSSTDTDTNYHILHNDPTPLSVKFVNPNLAAIIYQCLAKSPNNRYQSAQALISDLNAFLGGSAVSARPLSTPQKITNTVKKHPVRSLLAFMLMVSIVVFSSLLIRQQFNAQEQTKAVQQYTLLSKNLEQRIHAQHLLPSHNLTNHYQTIENELLTLLSGLKPTSLENGAVYASVGQTYELLNQPLKAVTAFENMQKTGFSTPQSETQYGLALALAWEHEQSRIVQLPDKAEREKARQQAQQIYLSLAKQKLKSAASKSDHKLYLAAYVAFLDKKHIETVSLANQAYEQDSTLYEAKRLAGLARLHQGKEYAIQGDAEQAILAYDKAQKHLNGSIEIARSDLKAHRYLCDLSEIKLHAFNISNRTLSDQVFQQATDDCNRADQLMDNQLTVLINLQEIYTQWSNWLLDLKKPIYQVAKISYELAQKTYQLKPNDTDVLTGMVLSLIKITELDNPHLNNTEKESLLNQAKHYAEKGIEINQEDAYNWANLGDVEITLATRNYANKDILDHIDNALKAYKQADVYLPSYAWQYMQGESYRVAADYLIKNERPEARQYLNNSKEKYQVALKQTPDFATAWKNLTMVIYQSIKLNDTSLSLNNSQEIKELSKALATSCRLYRQKGGFPSDLIPAMSFYNQVSDKEIVECESSQP